MWESLVRIQISSGGFDEDFGEISVQPIIQVREAPKMIEPQGHFQIVPDLLSHFLHRRGSITPTCALKDASPKSKQMALEPAV